jgi:prepilin-type processing-associated H-X9-DG protein
MTDIDKAYYEANIATDLSNESIFLEPNYLLGNHSTWTAPGNSPPCMWVPHVGGTKANMLFMDGHISTATPNDFILSTAAAKGANINTKVIPWGYTPPTGSSTISDSSLKSWIIGYYKVGNSPLWVDPWVQGANGI